MQIANKLKFNIQSGFQITKNVKIIQPRFDGFEIIDNEKALLTLEEEWNALWLRAYGAAFFQTHSYCLQSWKTITSKKPQYKLCCVVKRENGRLVLVWPLVSSRKGLWLAIEPHGPKAAEYTQPLVEDNSDAELYVELAWQYFHKRYKPDFVYMTYVKENSLLHKTISKQNNEATDAFVAPFVEWQNEKDWDAYYKTLSTSYRKVQNKKRRQLNNGNTVTFEVINDKSQFEQIINWLLVEKQKWGNRVNKKGDWVFSENYRDFLVKFSTDEKSIQPIIIYVLKLNNKIIAAQLAAVGTKHIDWIIAGFDAEAAHSSPGILLNEYCLQWAFERKLNCDFGVGSEENKMFWSKGNYVKTNSFRVINTSWGRLALIGRNLQRKAKNTLNYKQAKHEVKITA